MRPLRSAIWICLFLLGLAGVVFPSIYLYVSSKLPQLESEFDLERHLKNSIEGERMSLKLGQYQRRTGIAFERPDFSRLPKEFVAIYISQLGCPAYFRSAKEGGGKWLWRLFGGAYFNAQPPGDGACEKWLSLELASAVGIHGSLETHVAANKIHGFLQKDQLLSYQLAAIPFERGVVGVEDAARTLFDRPLRELSLNQLAELALALPPNNFYTELHTCKNGPLIRQARDSILADLVRDALVSRDAARVATEQPVTCLRLP